MRNAIVLSVLLVGCGSSSSGGDGATQGQGGSGAGATGGGGTSAAAGTGGIGGSSAGGAATAGTSGTAGVGGATTGTGGASAGAAGTSAGAAGTSAGAAGAAGAGGAAGDTWATFASGFFATYCVECHAAGNPKRDYTTLAGVMKDAPLVRCGVAPAMLANCGPTGPAPKQFPISNATKTNPKPSDADRARVVAWIDAGMP